MKYVCGGIGLFVGFALPTSLLPKRFQILRYPGVKSGIGGFVGYLFGSNADFYQNLKEVSYN